MYLAEQSAPQAEWYLKGECSNVSGSKSAESTHFKSSLRLQHNDACSRDLMTDVGVLQIGVFPNQRN